MLVVRAQEGVLAEAQLERQAALCVAHAHHAAVVDVDAADDQVVDAGHHLRARAASDTHRPHNTHKSAPLQLLLDILSSRKLHAQRLI